MKKVNIILTFILSLFIIFIYIYTYNHNLSIFWIIFVIERILSPKFNKLLDSINLESDNESDTFILSEFIIKLISLCILGIIMLLYVLFKYPKLFIILIIGEIIDNIIEKLLKYKLTNKKNID